MHQTPITIHNMFVYKWSLSRESFLLTSRPYVSLSPPTGTTITCAGDSQKGLRKEEKGELYQFQTSLNSHTHTNMRTHTPFPPKVFGQDSDHPLQGPQHCPVYHDRPVHLSISPEKHNHMTSTYRLWNRIWRARCLTYFKDYNHLTWYSDSFYCTAFDFPYFSEYKPHFLSSEICCDIKSNATHIMQLTWST